MGRGRMDEREDGWSYFLFDSSSSSASFSAFTRFQVASSLL